MSRPWLGVRSSSKPERKCEYHQVLALFFIALLRTDQTSSEEQPAFFHSYEYLRGHKLGVIRLNQEVAERMARDGIRETLHPHQLPMLVKPKPWLSYDQGGYLYSQSNNSLSLRIPVLSPPFQVLPCVSRTPKNNKAT